MLSKVRHKFHYVFILIFVFGLGIVAQLYTNYMESNFVETPEGATCYTSQNTIINEKFLGIDRVSLLIMIGPSYILDVEHQELLPPSLQTESIFEFARSRVQYRFSTSGKNEQKPYSAGCFGRPNPHIKVYDGSLANDRNRFDASLKVEGTLGIYLQVFIWKTDNFKVLEPGGYLITIEKTYIRTDLDSNGHSDHSIPHTFIYYKGRNDDRLEFFLNQSL